MYENNAKLTEAIKTLADFGLGAVLLHSHGQNGDIVDIPHDVVQLEEDLSVSFVSRDDPKLQDASIVGWRFFNGEVIPTMYCKKNHGRCLHKLNSKGEIQ